MGMRWREQAGIDLKGARETVTAAEEADRDGMGWKSDRGKRGRLLGWDSGREYNVAKLSK